MSARRQAEDARRARQIRGLQEQAALDRLRIQSAIAIEAARLRDVRAADHAAAQDGWHDALGQGALDPAAAGLWRFYADAALRAARLQEAVSQSETEQKAARQNDWARCLQLADAAQTIERRTAGVLRKRADEAALRTAEDMYQARRVSQ